MAKRLLGLVDALDQAAAEILHEANYYATRGGPPLARRFLDDFEQTARRILQEPRSFRAWPDVPGVRRARLAHFPFAIGFVIGPPGSDDLPMIVTVAHDKRRPGYWVGRLAKRRRPR